MRALRIKEWGRYEHADSRKSATMPWIKTPTKHDGLGFLTLMEGPAGLAHFGAWVLILQISATCPTRGLLVTDGGRPYGSRELALKTRGCAATFADAIVRLVEIGWLEWVEVDASTGVATPIVARVDARPPVDSGQGRDDVGTDPGPEKRERREEKTASSPPQARALPHLPEERQAAATAAALAKRIRGVDSHRVRDAVARVDLIDLVASLGGNTAGTRRTEWLRDTDGMQIGEVAAILAWARFEDETIREPSGFRKVNARWCALSAAERLKHCGLLREFGLPVPGEAA